MKVLFKTTLCDFSGYVSAYEIFIKASNSSTLDLHLQGYVAEARSCREEEKAAEKKEEKGDERGRKKGRKWGQRG